MDRTGSALPAWRSFWSLPPLPELVEGRRGLFPDMPKGPVPVGPGCSGGVTGWLGSRGDGLVWFQRFGGVHTRALLVAPPKPCPPTGTTAPDVYLQVAEPRTWIGVEYPPPMHTSYIGIR